MSGQVPYVSQSVGMTAADAQQVGTDQTVVASTTSLTDINKVVRVEASLTGASITGNCAVSGNVSASSLAVTGAITGGSINSTPIGATTPSTGAFTTLSASGSAKIGAGNNGLVIQSYTGGGYGALYSGGVVPTDTNYSFVLNPFSTVLNVPIGGSVTITTGAGTSSLLLNVSATNVSLTGGRFLIGTTTDDGVNALQVNGAGIFAGLIKPQQATTAGAPAYVKGAIYFDTTLNKLRVGGATAWETITSV